MKLRLVCVGKPSGDWLPRGVADYEARIGRYLPYAATELKEEKGNPAKGDIPRIREREGERILEKLPAGAFVVVLDERGAPRTSEQLSELLARQMLAGNDLVLVIGGAYGLSDAVRQRADLVLSLSALTLTHQMARLLLCEQLYRALTILRNEPYHNR